MPTGFPPGNKQPCSLRRSFTYPSVSPCRSKFWFWVKSGAFALCAIFIMMPILEELPEIIRQRVYYHRSKLTPGNHCSNPPMQKYTVNVSPLILCWLIYIFAVRAPFVFDLSHPAELALNHTINMYLEPEEGISLGIWCVCKPKATFQGRVWSAD